MPILDNFLDNLKSETKNINQKFLEH